MRNTTTTRPNSFFFRKLTELKPDYKSRGFEDRTEYLQATARDFDIPFEQVLELANMLGSQDDFDGLLSSLEGWRN